MIAVIVNELNIRGGTHKQVLRFVEYLEKNNIEYQLLTRYYNPELTYAEFKKYNVFFLKKEAYIPSNKWGILSNLYNRIHDFKEQVKLFRLINKKVDIVNVHDNNLSIVLLMSKILRKKVIWQINDLPGCFMVGGASRDKERYIFKYARIFYRFLAKYIDIITVNVSKNSNLVKRCMNKDAKVFYCGTDLEKNTSVHKNIKNKGYIKLLSVGVWHPNRNYESLVEVVNLLKSEAVDCQLDIVGSLEIGKEYCDRVIALIKKYKLENNIFIRGQLGEVELEKTYKEADIFLFINIEQSWGLAVFEAMGKGLPVIVSNGVGAIELLTNNKNALIVDPFNIRDIADKIKLLVNDKLYEKIASNGFNDVQDYSWDNLYNKKMLSSINSLREVE